MGTATAHASLNNCRVLITRAREQSEATREAVLKRGGSPVLLPVIQILERELTDAVKHSVLPLSAYQWLVFSSANGLRGFARNFRQEWQMLQPESRPQVAVVGKRTAQAATQAGFPIDFRPPSATGLSLGQNLPVQPADTVLFPCGNLARTEIPDHLEARGAHCHMLTVYETAQIHHDRATIAEALSGSLGAVLLTSPSTVDGLLTNCREANVALPSSAILACIGETTANRLKQWGFQAHLVPEEKGIGPLLDALAANWNSLSQLNR